MRLVRETGIVLGFLVLTRLLDLASSAVIARRVGPAVVGALAVGRLMLEFATILENWSTPAHVREASAADEAELGSLYVTHALLKVGLGLVGGLLILATSGYVAELVDVDVLILRIFAAVPPVAAVSSSIHNTLEARGRMVGRGVMDTVTAAAFLVWAVAVVQTGPDAATGRFVAAGATAALGLLVFLPGLAAPSTETARHYLSFGARTGVSDLLMKTIFWADTGLLAYLVGNAAAGHYQVAYGIGFVEVVAASAVATALFPALSRGALEAGGEAFRDAFRRGFVVVTTLVGAGGVVLAASAPVIVPLLFGDAFLRSVLVLQLLAGSFFLDAVGVPSSLALTAEGHPGVVTAIQGVMAAVNLGGNLLLIPVYGITGAVAVTFVTFGLGSALEIVLAWRLLDLVPPRRPGAWTSLARETLASLRGQGAG